jgi:hypothetical protein
MKFLNRIVFGTAAALSLVVSASAQNENHFHPKGKPASTHTIEVLENARATLNFADKRDFD